MTTTFLLAFGLLDGATALPCPTCGHARSTGLWLTIGFLGQAIFTARFLAQWVASERRRDSVVPVAFWWLSILGGVTLLIYAVHREDPVIIVGQSMGVFIYARNLMLVAKGKRRAARRKSRQGPHAGPHRAEAHDHHEAGPGPGGEHERPRRSIWDSE
jgi:lipid-A-disaccharide synthase-like uncharacterized protein